MLCRTNLKWSSYEKSNKHLPHAYTHHISHRRRLHCKRKRGQEYTNDAEVSTAGTLIHSHRLSRALQCGRDKRSVIDSYCYFNSLSVGRQCGVHLSNSFKEEDDNDTISNPDPVIEPHAVRFNNRRWIRDRCARKLFRIRAQEPRKGAI